MTERRRWLVAALVLSWLAAVYLAFYYVHKPIRPPQAAALIRVAADLVTIGLVAAVAGGLGVRLLGEALPAGRAEAVAWSAGFGLGFVALAMLALGAVGGYRAWLVWCLLLSAALLLRRDVSAWLKLLRELLRNRRALGRAASIWQGYTAALFALSLLLALLPPTAWDALVYHLTAPKLYIQAGRLVHPLDLPYLGFPQLGEMLFTAAMLLRRPATTQLVSLLYGALLVLGTYGLVARRWGRSAGTLAAAILFSALSVAHLLSWPYVDTVLMFYTLATFAALTYWMEQDSWRWIVVAGLFAGMAMATKYTAVAIPVGAGLVSLVHDSRRKGKALLLLALAAGAFTAPWLVKNWLLTGNPVYPFFLPGEYWDSYRRQWYGRPGTGLAATAPWQILLAPWYATVWAVEGKAGFSSTIGPLFLGLAPLVPITWRWQQLAHRRFLCRMALFVVPTYALWLVGIGTSAQLAQTRLLFPIFPLLAILVTAGVTQVDLLGPRYLRLGWVVRVLIAFVLLLNLVSMGLTAIQHKPLETLAGFRSDEDYLTDRLGWHQAAMRELPADSRVLFLWEPRSFYCQVECWPDAPLDGWWHARQTLGDPAAIAGRWRADGITHVLLFKSGYEFILAQGFDPITAADQAALDDLLANETILEQDFGGVYTLYRLRP